MSEYMAFVSLYSRGTENNCNALTELLNKGWRVDDMCPMSSATSTNESRALVILKKE